MPIPQVQFHLTREVVKLKINMDAIVDFAAELSDCCVVLRVGNLIAGLSCPPVNDCNNLKTLITCRIVWITVGMTNFNSTEGCVEVQAFAARVGFG